MFLMVIWPFTIQGHKDSNLFLRVSNSSHPLQAKMNIPFTIFLITSSKCSAESTTPLRIRNIYYCNGLNCTTRSSIETCKHIILKIMFNLWCKGCIHRRQKYQKANSVLLSLRHEGLHDCIIDFHRTLNRFF